jgi:hypothetical protein
LQPSPYTWAQSRGSDSGFLTLERYPFSLFQRKLSMVYIDFEG